MKKLYRILIAVAFIGNVYLNGWTKTLYEPDKGCYIGASLDWGDIAENQYKSFTNVVDKFDLAIKDFNKLMGKKHAIFNCFIFFPHGAQWEDKKYTGLYPTWSKDPCKWAAPKDYLTACERNKAGILFTVEPWVTKDFYSNWREGNNAYNATVEFAKGCAKAKVPVFVRFAHEMNGCWYPWSSWMDKNQSVVKDPGEETDVTPERYVIMYHNFVSVLRKYAPNVAIVWCPNQGWVGLDTGIDLFKDFYPGDEYVDWMGIDYYERGWVVRGIGTEKVWGGLFHFGLNNDMADLPNTVQDESINFYQTYCVAKNKPLMICETGATLSYRNDWTVKQRREYSHKWKMGYWNKGEQGWLYAVYGNSYYKEKDIYIKIDKELPLLKGILWFQQAKSEEVVVSEEVSKFILSKKRFHVFYNGWCDYRIGYNSTSPTDNKNKKSYFPDEMKTYFQLINNPYFLSDIVK